MWLASGHLLKGPVLPNFVHDLLELMGPLYVEIAPVSGSTQREILVCLRAPAPQIVKELSELHTIHAYHSRDGYPAVYTPIRYA